MSGVTDSSLDTWTEFAAAVAYVAQVERPGLTVWDALADAVHDWLPAGPNKRGAPGSGHDGLRHVVGHVLATFPESGAPGGTLLAATLDAAMANWSTAASNRVNDAMPFSR